MLDYLSKKLGSCLEYLSLVKYWYVIGISEKTQIFQSILSYANLAQKPILPVIFV